MSACACGTDTNHDHSSRTAFDPDASVPVSLGSSPITTSMAAPNRKPVTTARDKNLATQLIRASAKTRNSRPETTVMPATKTAT